MSSVHDRNREGLESTLKRVARMYATGEIGKDKFDRFAKTIESAFKQIDTMEEETTNVEA